MSGIMNPVYYNPLQTNAFKHVYGVLLQIQSNSSGLASKSAKKTKYEEFFKAVVHGFGKKGKVHSDLVERYKRGSLSFLDFMDSICSVQDLRMREVGKTYTLCWDYYYTYIEPRLLDVNELPIIRKTHLFIYWLVFCAVDLDCSCELTADKICDLLSFLSENSFQEAGPNVYSSLRRTNYSYDFVTFIQIIFANCLKTLNDNMKGELARKLYDRFVKGVILSGFLMRQQVVGPIKSYIKRLCKLTPNKLEVYEIGKNNEQRLKAEIVLNQHSQIAMIIKDFDPMKFYFQITCGHTQNITKFFAEDEITRFKWITEMKRVIKYHMEGNVTYQVDICSDQHPSNPGNLLYQVPDPKAMPVLKGKELNIDTIEDLDDESASTFGGASVITVNTSISQQIRASVIDEIIEESLYNQVPTNVPVKPTDADTVVSEGSEGSEGEAKRPAPVGQETGDDSAKQTIVEEQFYQNVDPNLPPPPIPGKKKQPKIDEKRPVAAPRRKTERVPLNQESPPGPLRQESSPALTSLQKPERNPTSLTSALSNPGTAEMPQPIPRRKNTNDPTVVLGPDSTDVPQETPITSVKEPKERPGTAPKPAMENAMPLFDPPPPILDPIELPTDSTTNEANTTLPTKSDTDLPPPKPAHIVKPVEQDTPIVKEEQTENIPIEKPTEVTVNKDN